MKDIIKKIIESNLPEEKEAGLYITGKNGGDYINYNREDNDDKREGFNQALSEINTSLIAEEVLRVVRQEVADLMCEHNEARHGNTPDDAYERVLSLLSHISLNEENK